MPKPATKAVPAKLTAEVGRSGLKQQSGYLLFYMSPIASVNDGPKRTMRDIVAFNEDARRHAFSIFLADRADMVSSKLRPAAALTNNMVISAFSKHIKAVFLASAKEEVGGIYAATVTDVASRILRIAAMANVHAFGDWPIVKFPRNTVCRAIAKRSDAERPIAIGDSADPKPTVSCLFNFLPEACFKGASAIVALNKLIPAVAAPCGLYRFAAAAGTQRGLICGRMRLHLKSPIQIWGAMPPAVSSSAGAFAC